MRIGLILAAAVAATGAASADAAVTYSYNGTLDRFSFTVAEYITSTTTLSAADAGCTGKFMACQSVTFDLGGSLADILTISNGTKIGPITLPGPPVVLAFSKGAFSGNGSLFGLTISGTPDSALAVPEPAQWAMLVAGFGLLGAALRRRPSTSVHFA